MSDKVVNLADWRNHRGKASSSGGGSAAVISIHDGMGVRDIVMDALENIVAKGGADEVSARMLLVKKVGDRLVGFQLQENHPLMKVYSKQTGHYTDEQIFNLLLNVTDFQLLTKPYFFKHLLKMARARIFKAEDRGNEWR